MWLSFYFFLQVERIFTRTGSAVVRDRFRNATVIAHKVPVRSREEHFRVRNRKNFARGHRVGRTRVHGRSFHEVEVGNPTEVLVRAGRRRRVGDSQNVCRVCNIRRVRNRR